MNNYLPVDLNEKVQYLKQKIDIVNLQIKKSQNYTHRINFIEFIDTTISKLLLFTTNQPGIAQLEKEKRKKQDIKQGAIYDVGGTTGQRQQAKLERIIMQHKIRQMQFREKEIQLEKLQIRLQNAQIQKRKVANELHDMKQRKSQDHKNLIFKVNAQEKQLERLGKINQALTQNNKQLKIQRNRAESELFQAKELYQKTTQEHITKKFKEVEGILVKKVYTNTTSKRESQRYVFCDLPIILQVNKLVYGIKIGVKISSKQIIYFNDIQLFQKQQIKIEKVQDYIQVEYLKRKKIVQCKKPQIHRNQITIMLYGKGDSISIYE